MPDKTIVQVPVKKTDLKDLHLYIEATTKTWNVLYLPKDSTGALIGGANVGPRSVSGTFSIADDPELFQWVDRVVVPAINAEEGT